MRFTKLFAFIWLIQFLYSCDTDPNSLSAINSESFTDKQIYIHLQKGRQMGSDSLLNMDELILSNDQHLVLNQLDNMNSMYEILGKSKSDSNWIALSTKWDEFNTKIFGVEKISIDKEYTASDSLNNRISPEAIRKWIELNIKLLKLSGEVRFGDALEEILYGHKKEYFSEELLKSVIYTHVFDQIYVNIIGSSSVDYQHTTGGNVRIIQETNYPNGNEMTLKSECSDLRYMDVFIRIPSWAINPIVTHGNVKYVARPGEYCQISRKWKTGDEIRVALRN